MSEYEALELSYKLWKWLYLNPGKSKQDSPYFYLNRNMLCLCPLCEFSIYYLGSFDCYKNCPGKFKKGCFNSAFAVWSDLRNINIWNDKNLYLSKITAAYIAAKIRRKIRKYEIKG